ncbi:MAG TPA: SCP2 sterol-binding domain-containing protein [Alphaproteobacteria bacterium]|jgi:putative sterol carrier protein
MNLQEATEAVKAKVGTDSGLGATVKFELEDGVIYVDAKTVPNVVSNEDKDADCTIRVTLENFSKMLQGDLDSTLAYMTGRLKVEGNMGVAMKLSSVL